MRIVVPVVLAGILLLTGCNGETSEAEPSPSPESSTTPTAELSPPGLPMAAANRTEEGAEAFAKHWIDTANYAIRSGDVEALRKVSDADCAGCQGGIEFVQKSYADGGRVEGGLITVDGFKSLSRRNGAEWAGITTARVSEQTVMLADGSEQVTQPARRVFRAYLHWTGSSWVMSKLETPRAT